MHEVKGKTQVKSFCKEVYPTLDAPGYNCFDTSHPQVYSLLYIYMQLSIFFSIRSKPLLWSREQ